MDWQHTPGIRDLRAWGNAQKRCAFLLEKSVECRYFCFAYFIMYEHSMTNLISW